VAIEGGREQAAPAHVVIEESTFSTIFSTMSSNGSAQFNSLQFHN